MASLEPKRIRHYTNKKGEKRTSLSLHSKAKNPSDLHPNLRFNDIENEKNLLEIDPTKIDEKELFELASRLQETTRRLSSSLKSTKHTLQQLTERSASQQAIITDYELKENLQKRQLEALLAKERARAESIVSELQRVSQDNIQSLKFQLERIHNEKEQIELEYQYKLEAAKKQAGEEAWKHQETRGLFGYETMKTTVLSEEKRQMEEALRKAGNEMMKIAEAKELETSKMELLARELSKEREDNALLRARLSELQDSEKKMQERYQKEEEQKQAWAQRMRELVVALESSKIQYAQLRQESDEWKMKEEERKHEERERMTKLVKEKEIIERQFLLLKIKHEDLTKEMHNFAQTSFQHGQICNYDNTKDFEASENEKHEESQEEEEDEDEEDDEEENFCTTHSSAIKAGGSKGNCAESTDPRQNTSERSDESIIQTLQILQSEVERLREEREIERKKYEASEASILDLRGALEKANSERKELEMTKDSSEKAKQALSDERDSLVREKEELQQSNRDLLEEAKKEKERMEVSWQREMERKEKEVAEMKEEIMKKEEELSERIKMEEQKKKEIEEKYEKEKSIILEQKEEELKELSLKYAAFMKEADEKREKEKAEREKKEKMCLESQRELGQLLEEREEERKEHNQRIEAFEKKITEFEQKIQEHASNEEKLANEAEALRKETARLKKQREKERKKEKEEREAIEQENEALKEREQRLLAQIQQAESEKNRVILQSRTAEAKLKREISQKVEEKEEEEAKKLAQLNEKLNAERKEQRQKQAQLVKQHEKKIKEMAKKQAQLTDNIEELQQKLALITKEKEEIEIGFTKKISLLEKEHKEDVKELEAKRNEEIKQAEDEIAMLREELAKKLEEEKVKEHLEKQKMQKEEEELLKKLKSIVSENAKKSKENKSEERTEKKKDKDNEEETEASPVISDVNVSSTKKVSSKKDAKNNQTSKKKKMSLKAKIKKQNELLKRMLESEDISISTDFDEYEKGNFESKIEEDKINNEKNDEISDSSTFDKKNEDPEAVDKTNANHKNRVVVFSFKHSEAKQPEQTNKENSEQADSSSGNGIRRNKLLFPQKKNDKKEHDTKSEEDAMEEESTESALSDLSSEDSKEDLKDPSEDESSSSLSTTFDEHLQNVTDTLNLLKQKMSKDNSTATLSDEDKASKEKEEAKEDTHHLYVRPYDELSLSQSRFVSPVTTPSFHHVRFQTDDHVSFNQSANSEQKVAPSTPSSLQSIVPPPPPSVGLTPISAPAKSESQKTLLLPPPPLPSTYSSKSFSNGFYTPLSTPSFRSNISTPSVISFTPTPSHQVESATSQPVATSSSAASPSVSSLQDRQSFKSFSTNSNHSLSSDISSFSTSFSP
ncbi:uncharacterized protein MONOS_10249 [Monocercomonoides exilis]|uniref:uncharacterized protein n=1 Tax=Monocercomonoides exilis TaxID=2049356 RepID=UPI00355990F0|nr:hypothetical protein MONOS_10249 [Monocercomonoides exilis]|eukprot:MONOS_10249.1-p1 / transcript=MONOS_10249.1 / gene=MONOS_10249 / organism=Monocercomonoides_exilis_PA203 / gene_product=unspecified product / transcript_product=unspecified product / location=Mono_scaffold00458:21148-25311(+) / protein_length=1365 / sequence_SO=supercontig / SO=protein_coding / is_pseudo=false